MRGVAGEEAAVGSAPDTRTGPASTGVSPAAAGTEPESARPRRLAVGRVEVDAILAAAVVVGAALRVWGLGRQAFWYDEWLTARAAYGGPSDLYHYVTDRAGIPPTYFALMWCWARVFGYGEAALRSVSALAGVATIPVAYAAARELGLRRAVARATALLVAVHPMLVWYSQEARPYALVALLGALSLWALARVWTRWTRRDLAVWALVCAVTISLHYFAVFLVVVEAAAVVAKARLWERRPSRRELLAVGWPAGVVLVALAPFGVRQFTMRGNHEWITEIPLVERLDDAGRSALMGPSYPSARLWLAAGAISALAVVLLVARGDSRERWTAAACAGLGLGSVAVALAVQVVGVDVIVARYLIVALVPLAIAVATGLCASRVPPVLGGAAVAAVCALSLVTVVAVGRDPDLQRADWEAVAAAHGSGGTDGGVRLLVVSNHETLSGPLTWYLDGGRPLDPDELVVVDQIDVLYARTTTQPCNRLVGMECSLLWLGTSLPEPVASRVVLDERIDLDQFWLERYRPDQPLQVTPADLVAPDFQKHTLVFVTDR